MKIAFLDRDGTLIFEPPDTKQIDSIEKLKILPGVIDGLKKLQADGFQLVMVSNQDGLGSATFPKKCFTAAQNEFLKRLKKEGIEFYKICICPDRKEDNCNCRKPKTGLVDSFLKKENINREQSFVLGDRATDMEFAQNIGVAGFKMQTNGAFPRIATVQRTTKETNINIACNLDGQGNFRIDTGLGFFNHLLEQFSKHSLIDLAITARGDLEIDEHHTIEDTALCLGECLAKALGQRKGIQLYGFLLPMDDTLVEVAIDLGGRPYFIFDAKFTREYVGDMPTEMIEHFFKSLSDALKANIHLKVRYSKNTHHQAEAIFKAFSKAMRQAVDADPRAPNILPSTKGIL